MMRFHWFWVVCAGLSLGLGCRKHKQPAPPPLLRVHFIGTANLLADSNSAGPMEFWRSAPAQAVEEETLGKLARAPYEYLRPRLGGNTNDFAARLRPMLDDWLREESYLEMRGPTNATPEVALAIHLDAARAQFWKTNLATVLESWTGLPTAETQIEGAAGWELRKHLAPNRIRLVQAGEWVVVNVGPDDLPLGAEIIKRVLTEKRPVPPAKDYWWRVEADWPRLARWVKLPADLGLPPMSLKTFGRHGYVRTEAELNYDGPREWRREAWRVPTNTIHEPLVSFTAVRGIRPWLSAQPLVQRQKLGTVPDQLYCWALGEAPFQTFLAAPMPEASNVVRRLGSDLVSTYGPTVLRAGLGTLQFQTNDTQVVWLGLPFVFPYLTAVREPAGEYLFAGLFANTQDPGPPPAELLAQLDRTNLLYYDWELTGQRLPQCRALIQVLRILREDPTLETSSAAEKWVEAISPKAGNTVTEITQTAPAQLSIVRSAPVGLASPEIALLANWLAATNFPRGFDLAVPSGAPGAGAAQKP